MTPGEFSDYHAHVVSQPALAPLRHREAVLVDLIRATANPQAQIAYIDHAALAVLRRDLVLVREEIRMYIDTEMQKVTYEAVG